MSKKKVDLNEVFETFNGLDNLVIFVINEIEHSDRSDLLKSVGVDIEYLDKKHTLVKEILENADKGNSSAVSKKIEKFKKVSEVFVKLSTGFDKLLEREEYSEFIEAKGIGLELTELMAKL